MIPFYIQKWQEVPGNEKSNRKSALCPICGREELISKDSELVKCSICCQTRSEDKPVLKGEDIKKLREKIRVSLKNLADDLKIDAGLLSKIENNKRPVSLALQNWYKKNTNPDTQNSPLNPEVDKDISTYQPPLFCQP